MHDARIGRFLSIDPLAAKYPFYSPYAFSGNRVIDGVELEGLEYLDSDESRIHITGGIVKLKISNFHNVTVSTMRRSLGHGEMHRDPYGNRTIGLNTIVLNFHHPSTQLVSPNFNFWTNYPGPIRNTPGSPIIINTFIQRVEAEPATPDFKIPVGTALNRPLKGDGTPHMSYKVNKEYWPVLDAYFAALTEYRRREWQTQDINNGIHASRSPGVRAAAGLFLFIELGGHALAMSKNLQIADDRETFSAHVDLLLRAMDNVGDAVINGDIPENYINTNSLSAIVNFVLLGENSTDDPRIEELGKKVIECYSSCELQD